MDHPNKLKKLLRKKKKIEDELRILRLLISYSEKEKEDKEAKVDKIIT